MSAPACRNFDGCSAPICPDDQASLAHCVWFPDEETCSRSDLRGTPWIARQRKIARATGRDFARGCFTVGMLAHDCRVGRGIKGLDPDAGDASVARVQKWIGEHPPLHAFSDTERAKLRARMLKIRAANTAGKSVEGRLARARATSEAKTVSKPGGDREGANP